MIVAALVAGELAAPTRPGALTGPRQRGADPAAWAGPVGRLVATGLRGAEQNDPVAAFYARRGWRPLWTQGSQLRPEAAAVVAQLAAADDQGLAAPDYLTPALQSDLSAARTRDPDRLARAEVGLSRAFASYLADLRGRRTLDRLAFVDPGLRLDPIDAGVILEQIAGARDLRHAIAAASMRSPPYETYRRAWLAERNRRGQEDLAQADWERPVIAGLERLRAIPANPGPRYIVVDAASAQLELWENGRVVDAMPVGVGKVQEPTPEMAGLIRYAVFRPYWNVPPDLTRDRIAPQVVAHGLAALQAQHLEVLSDWTDNAVPMDPAALDWAAVGTGSASLHLRQRPGPDNMMGKVKFMLPNPLGVYLHDTPLKALLKQTRRNVSAGCVRLSDASRLTSRLLGDGAVPTGVDAEHKVDLSRPVPVFITYLTAAPGKTGFDARPDVYGRDPALLARIGRSR